MRIGLYGLPTAGKTYILDSVRGIKALSGSKMLLELNTAFHTASEDEKKLTREKLASELSHMDNFIMDGHYSFGDKIVFTNKDGELYDAILYLYVDSNILRKRMEKSERNYKYLQYDLERWQLYEIEALREYCHLHNKDFYIIDNPIEGYWPEINIVLEFIYDLINGFSCEKYARTICEDILSKCHNNEVCLVDGDKTLIREDSCGIIGYTTHIFDGNFYTGFQSWRHHRELDDYLKDTDYICPSLDQIEINFNDLVKVAVNDGCILTTGYMGIWRQVAQAIDAPVYYGAQMSAETKFFITKFLQTSGRRVNAYGDGMNDYYMLKQADKGYLIRKKNGEVSRSLRGKDLGGIHYV